jgi:uncharacterized coiled-coil DUF342 family protein
LEGQPTRQDVFRWIGEAHSVFEAIQQMLDENERLRSSAGAATKERERLRDEIHGLRDELEQFRKTMREMQRLMNELAPKFRRGVSKSAARTSKGGEAEP